MDKLSELAKKIAAKLTDVQAKALTTSFLMLSDGQRYPRMWVRIDVRRRLHAKGLLGKQIGHPLTKLGEAVRATLSSNASDEVGK